uniref:FP protein C-terminal domain-containing protein n=1 Tax=Heliothis virescens TaxID=7102 RepID=A0A2A4JGT4_HELVI
MQRSKVLCNSKNKVSKVRDICPECKKNVGRDNESETPVRNSQAEAQTPMAPISAGSPLMETTISEESAGDKPSGATDMTSDKTGQDKQMDVAFQLQAIMEELRGLRQEVLELRKELKSLSDACNGRMDTIEARLLVLEERHAEVPADATAVEGVVEQLKRELNERDQELMANDLVIANLQESQAENPVHVVKIIATKLGVQLDDRDIVYAERIGGRHLKATSPTKSAEVRPRAVMVRLARRDLRDAFLDSARLRRGATSEDLGLPGPARRFYVNERLTKSNQELFRQARAAAGIHGWRFVWTKRGRILVRNKPGDQARRIGTVQDIQDIIGQYTV